MKIPSKIVTLDWETYFDQQYRLKRHGTGLSTSEYVRDERFKAHGVAIRTPRDKATKWYHGAAIKKKLSSINWKTHGLLCHNTAFDGLILSHHHGIVPAWYFDTLSMARAIVSNTVGFGLDEVAQYLGKGNKMPDVLMKTKGIRDLPPELLQELGDYAIVDGDLTYEIFQEWYPDFPEDETRIIHHTIAAFANPILQVDVPRAQADLKRTRAKNTRMFGKVAHLLDFGHLKGKARTEAVGEVLRSDNKLADAYEKIGFEVPMKTTAKGNVKPAFAKNDLAFQEMLASDDKNVKLLSEARQLAKSNIAENRAIKLISHAKPALPIMLNYCKAHTMRWSGGDDLNPQNFPSRGKGKYVKELRRSIIAPPGHKLVVVDSSGIEGRMLAWVAGDKEKLNFVEAGGDMYNRTATMIYGYEVNRKDPKFELEGMVGKTAELGLGYKMWANKFQHTLAVGQFGPPVHISLEESKKAVLGYRKLNWKIEKFWAFMDDMLKTMVRGEEYDWRDGTCVFHPEGVDMPNGLTLLYPDLQAKYNPYSGQYVDFSYAAHRGRAHIYDGLFTENFVQCLSRIIVGEQLLQVADDYRLASIVHDEGVFCVPNNQAEKCLEDVIQALRTPSDWCLDLPFNATGSISDNYGDAK